MVTPTLTRAAPDPSVQAPKPRTASISDGLSLLSLADDARRALGQDEGAHTPEADSEGVATYEGATSACEPPPGIVSPPAVTVFGGGIGATNGSNGDGGDANVAHSAEVSESENDLEAPPPAPAPAAPSDGSAGGALQ